MVGIDIGTYSIKVVEISSRGKNKKLENYGEVKSSLVYQEPLTDKNSGEMLSNELLPQAIREILDEAKIKTKSVTFSIPDFFTFCTSFEIPPMEEEEIPEAIHYNASQYITLPIAEVTLDWQIIPNSSDNKNSPSKVFLVAVPNQTVEEYKEVARNAGLEVYALESEVLGLRRALVKNSNKKTICLIDVGVQSSTINIVDEGFLKRSYSFNFNSNQAPRPAPPALGVDQKKPEEVKNNEGVVSVKNGIPEQVKLLVNPLLDEVKSISAEFFHSNQREVEEVYLTGGVATIPGLADYFTESLKKNVLVPNCFSEFLYPPILGQTLEKMSPSFSVAVGVALGGIET